MPDSNQGSLPQKSGALPPHLHGKPPHFLPICFKLAAAEIAGNVSTPEPEGDTKDKAMMEQQIQVMKVTLNQKLFLFS